MNHIKLLIVMNDVQVDASVAQHPLIPQGLFTYEEIYSIGSGRTLLQIPYYKTTIEDYFMIVYTSGTTGLPKGAIHSQYSMLTILVYMREPPEMVGWKSAFIWPLGHISGSLFIVRCFVSGMAPVIFRRNVLDETLAKVDRYKIDQLIITPAHAVPLVINDYEYDLTSLKLIIFGGSKIPVQLKEQIYDKFKAPVIEYYGATEMMSGVLIKSYWTADCPPGSVGYVIGDNELKIVSLDTGESLAAMEQGEICMRGPTRFVGYLDNTEATRDTIDSDGWYHSGDVGYYDHSGALFVVDRIKEIIKYKHWTIFPSEIEIFLSRHKTIEAACVVGVKHATDGELVRAYVQLKPTYSDTTKEDITNYVQNNLGFQKQLRGGVYFVEELPRISIGKVDRKYFKNLIKEELITEVIE